MLNTEGMVKKLGRHRKYVQWLCKYGLIETRDYGRGYFTTEEAVEDFIEWSRGKSLRNKADIIREAKERNCRK